MSVLESGKDAASASDPADAYTSRIEGLDGLRALAVTLVLLTHGAVLAMGWIGVQLFFVLSGFLITRVLLADRAATQGVGAYLGRFYTRRVLRIFPIYYAYLLLLSGAMLLVPQLAKLREHLAPAFLYVYNLYGAIEYPQHSRMLVHLWSLSVEEQFYLLWPLAIALISARRQRSLAIALIVAAPILRWAVAYWWPLGGLLNAPASQAIYSLTTSHLDAFAWGALLNFIRYRPRLWHLAAVIGVALIAGFAVNGIGSGLRFSGTPRLTLGWPLFMPLGGQFIWGYSLINFGSFVLLALVLRDERMRRFFSWRPLAFIGLRSYSVYLVHLPILALMIPGMVWLQARLGDAPGALIFQVPYACASILVATATYRWIELPFLRLRNRYRPASAMARVPSAAPMQLT